MNSEILIASVALVISIISGIWSFKNSLNTKKADRVNKVTELSIIFNETDFHHSRKTGWALLETIKNSESPITFKMLWSDVYDMEKVTEFGHLYRVLSFWHMLFILGEQNEIDKTLANKIFQYEYYWWSQQVSSLIKNTYDGKEEIPSFCEVFLNNPQWLKEGKKA